MSKGRQISLNKYETIFIISPDAESEVVERIIDQVQNLISEGGGVVTKVDNWGKKRLAYEVRGNKDGIYVIVTLEAGPQIIPNLARYYGLDEQIIKYMTVRAEKIPEPRVEMSDGERRSSRESEDDGDDEDGDDEE
jgi:small subunit ribosomal protein S6